MDVERQKGQQHHGDGEPDGTGSASHGGRLTSTALDSQRALTDQLMEQVCEPSNIVPAYRRVRANKGTPGVDRMTVRDLADCLRANHATLTASLLDGPTGPSPCLECRSPSREEDYVSWGFQPPWIVWYNR